MAAADFSRIWNALADPHRRKLMDLMRERPRTTGELASRFEVSRFAIMKHLEILTAAHLVFSVRQGRVRWNHLNPVPLKELVDRWLMPFEAASAAALLRLKQVSEAPNIQGEPMSETTSALSAYDVRLEIKIRAKRQHVWQALVHETGQWWPKHFYTGPNPRNFIVEPRVGGRVYEDWGDDAGGLWGVVVLFQPEEKMQWAGDMFPDYGGTGRYIATYALRSDGDHTVVHFHDSGFGALKPGAGESLRSGWEELLGTHLKAHAEAKPDKARGKARE